MTSSNTLPHHPVYYYYFVKRKKERRNAKISSHILHSLDGLPAIPHALGQALEHRDRIVPSDTRIRNADALFQTGRSLGWDLLVSLKKIGFDHDADNGSLACAELLSNVRGDQRLVAVVFGRVSCKIDALAEYFKKRANL